MTLTDQDRVMLKGIVGDLMLDSCKRQVRVDASGFGTNVTYTAQAEQACGFNPTQSREERTGQSTRSEADATLRLPLTATVLETDRFQITKRHGETLSPALMFDVEGPVQRGVTSWVIKLVEIDL